MRSTCVRTDLNEAPDVDRADRKMLRGKVSLSARGNRSPAGPAPLLARAVEQLRTEWAPAHRAAGTGVGARSRHGKTGCLGVEMPGFDRPLRVAHCRERCQRPGAWSGRTPSRSLPQCHRDWQGVECVVPPAPTAVRLHPSRPSSASVSNVHRASPTGGWADSKTSIHIGSASTAEARLCRGSTPAGEQGCTCRLHRP